MDAKLRQNWIDALRSGKYQQTRGNLRDENGFCCLGVLCDVMGANWHDGRPLLGGKSIRSQSAEYITDDCGAGIHRVEQETLASLNDDGVPLAEIADYVEQYILAEG